MSLLSVILPSFNEEANIANTATVIGKILEDNQIEYELIFIDDGSKDQTYSCILEQAQKK